MAQFEDYVQKQIKHQGEVARIDEYQKGLLGAEIDIFDQPEEVQKFDVEYDPAQLEEKFQKRLADTTYKARTLYYFQDAGMYAAKARRYWKISNQNEGGEIDQFADEYRHTGASKRRKAAKKAGNAFGKAALLVQKNREKEKKAKNDYEIFEMREAVMRLRMEGMENAAEAKARNATHEKYLKYKARISCLTMLQDQLKNLRKNAKRFNNNQAVIQKFYNKSASLRAELATAKQKLSAVAVSADQTWALENDVKGKVETLYDGSLNDRNVVPQMKANQAKTLAVLQTINAQNQNNAAPLYTLRLDRNHQPINKAEAQKMEWNKKYNQVMQGDDHDQNAKNEMLLSIAKRVERYQLPDFNAFQNGSVLEQFQSHAVEYHEMLLKTPDFLNGQMNDKNGVLAQYANQHPLFKAKLQLLTAMGRHLKDTMKENNIDPKTAKISKMQGMLEMNDEERRQQIATSYEAYRMKEQTQNAAQEKIDPQKVLSLETQADQDAEYAQLRQRNPGFTKKQYKVYKGLKSALAVYEDQAIWDRVNAMSPQYTDKKNSDLEASRDLGMVLRAVHYDKNGKPISEEDRRKAAQNERWIKAWEADLNDEAAQKTKLELVMKELPNVLDGFDFPEPQNVEQWFKKNMEERPFEFQEMVTRSLSISNMEKRFPWITEYINTHTVFREKLKIMSRLATLLNPGIQCFYNLRAQADNFRLGVVKADSREEAEATMADRKVGFDDYVAVYPEVYNQSQPILAQIEAEKQQMRTTNPEFTDAQYDILKNVQMCYAVLDKEPYIKQLENAQKKPDEQEKVEEPIKIDDQEKLDEQKKDNKTSSHAYSISREPASVLRSVVYNSVGNPLTKEDEKLKEQNDKWMKAWEDGNEKLKQEMALEIVPKMFDGFDFPEPKNMQKWVDDQMHQNTFRFMEMLRRATSLSDLQNLIPAVREFEEKNTEFRNKRTLACVINNYVNNYLRIQNINNKGGNYELANRDTYEDRKNLHLSAENAVHEYENQYKQIKEANA